MLPARDEILKLFQPGKTLTAKQIWEKICQKRDDISYEEVLRIVCQLIAEKKIEAIGAGDEQSVLRCKTGKG